MTEQPARVRSWAVDRFARGLVAFGVAANATVARADIKPAYYGDYFCYTQYEAGIQVTEPGRPPTVGAFRVDESDKFFLKVEPIRRDIFEVEVCRRFRKYYLERLKPDTPIYDTDQSLDFAGRQSRAITCTASTLMTVTRPNDTTPDKFYASEWSMYGRGLVPNSWFSLFGDGTFKMEIGFDAGPIMFEGRCQRLTVPGRTGTGN